MRQWTRALNKTQKDKTSMDFKFILLALTIVFSSCASIKKTAENAGDAAENVWKAKRPFSLLFQIHHPYCGGAAPTKEMADGFNEPMANQVFYIYEGERPSSVTKMTKVTTDETGRFKIDLPQGTYSVIRASKAMPLDEFIEMQKINGEHYTYSDDQCFKTWRNTPDFTVEHNKGHVDETVTLNAACFTGDNPCMQYNGPYPP